MGNALRAEYYISPEDYLAGERVSQQKHEYLAGVIYAMAGTTIGHGRIAGNIYRRLGNQLDGRRCEAFSSEIKVRIRKDAADFFYYPDVTVDCSGAGNATLFAEEPRVIFEVLSPDTESTDRREKFFAYTSIPTLEAYILVEQGKIGVTAFRRVGEGWATEAIEGSEAVLQLSRIEMELPLALIYEEVL